MNRFERPPRVKLICRYRNQYGPGFQDSSRAKGRNAESRKEDEIAAMVESASVVRTDPLAADVNCHDDSRPFKI